MRPDRSYHYYNKIIYSGCQSSREKKKKEEKVITFAGVGRLRCLMGVFGRLDHPASSTDKTWNIELFGKLFVEQTKIIKIKIKFSKFLP